LVGSQEWGVGKVKLVTFVSSPEGIKSLQEEFPDVDIITGSIDEGLGQYTIYIVHLLPPCCVLHLSFRACTSCDI
jgi:uracil phosphoribosyltransferase